MSSTDGADRPNVVLIVADTARADEAVADGPTVMPTLQTLAKEGTDYRSAFASAPWTLPSHAGLFTGTYSSKHGAHGGHPRLEGHVNTIAESFAQHGYETFAASNNTWISGEFGFDRGFEQFWKGWQLIQSDDDVGSIVHKLGPVRRARAAVTSALDGNPVVNAINACYNHWSRSRGDYGARRTTDRIERWLQSRTDSIPFFAFVNYLEPHIRYYPPPEYAEPFLPADVTWEEAVDVRQEPRAYDVGAYELSTHELARLRGLYRGELAHVDAQIARIREALEQCDRWENTIVIVMGDHGENIGDHGFLGHQYNLYDTLLHVPLIIAGGPFDGGGCVEELVQLTDIVPTLLDVANLQDPTMADQAQGRSLLAGTGTPRQYVIAEYMAPQPPTEVLADRYGTLPAHAERFDRQLRSIRTPTEKLIRGSDGRHEFYDVAADPGERTDLGSSRPGALATLERMLDDWLEGFEHAERGETVELSRGAERRLAELGYL